MIISLIILNTACLAIQYAGIQVKVKGHPGPHQALRAPVKLHCRLQTPHPPQFLISRENLYILLTGQPSDPVRTELVCRGPYQTSPDFTFPKKRWEKLPPQPLLQEISKWGENQEKLACIFKEKTD